MLAGSTSLIPMHALGRRAWICAGGGAVPVLDKGSAIKGYRGWMCCCSSFRQGEGLGIEAARGEGVRAGGWVSDAGLGPGTAKSKSRQLSRTSIYTTGSYLK